MRMRRSYRLQWKKHFHLLQKAETEFGINEIRFVNNVYNLVTAWQGLGNIFPGILWS